MLLISQVVIAMCGIGGVWCLGNAKLSKRDAKKLRYLAIYLETRGQDAFGFYNGEKVIKFPSSATDVIKMIDRIKPFNDLVVGRNMFLMHTRASTEGDPLKNKNNHPFELKDIVFAHNGIMYYYTKYEDIRFKNGSSSKYVDYIDTYEIFGKIEVDLPETDSFEIGVEIQKEYNESRDFVTALSEAFSFLVHYGDMAVWVYSKREDLLALFKHGRPLFIGFDNEKLWFASEEWMLRKIDVNNIRTLKEGELIVYSRAGEECFEIIEGEYSYKGSKGFFLRDEEVKELERDEREYWRLYRDYGFWYY